MDDLIYTVTLSDGTRIENLTLNGNNYVSKTELSEDIFKDNLSFVTISNGETEEILRNVELVQLAHYEDGWYFVLREIPADRLERQRLEMDLEQTQLALCDLYEKMLGAEE